MPAELIVIIGPCGSGKTTWSRTSYPDHAHPDAEELARTLFATPDRFRYHAWTRTTMASLLDAAASRLVAQRVPTCVTIRGATRAERAPWVAMAQTAGVPAHLVRLAVDRDTCVSRAKADPSRPRSSRRVWPTIVANWFRDYEPVSSGEGFTSHREVVP